MFCLSISTTAFVIAPPLVSTAVTVAVSMVGRAMLRVEFEDGTV